jgi:hypothetical protein
MKHYGKLGLCGLLICLGACNAIGSVDTRATMQAEQTAYVEEGTRIAGTLEARGTEVVTTAVAAQTYVANVDGINRQLAVTLRAVNPPTQQVVDTSGLVTPGMVVNPGELSVPAPISATQSAGASGDNTNVFSEIGTAARVRQADDCADGLQSQFSSGDTQIYVTSRVLNARSGTVVIAEWYYNGQLVTPSEPFTIPRDDDDFCLWFYIEPTDAPFSPGDWSAQFVVNGVAIQPVATFTIS